MADKKHDEGIEFILQHWDLVSDQKKKILELLGITPTKPNYKTSYETTDNPYKSPGHEEYKQDSTPQQTP